MPKVEVCSWHHEAPSAIGCSCQSCETFFNKTHRLDLCIQKPADWSPTVASRDTQMHPFAAVPASFPL